MDNIDDLFTAVLNDPDVSHAVSIPTNQNDNFIYDDDTDSSSSWSHVHNVTRDMNSIMDSSTGHAEALAACQVDICPFDSVLLNRREISFQVHGPEPCSSWWSSSPLSSPLSSPSSGAGDASENDIEYQVPVQAEDKQEQLVSNFKNMDIVPNNDTKTNTLTEPQPSSSKMNRKAFKRNNVYPFTSRNTKVRKLESAFNKKCQMKVQQGKVSKSYLSVGTPSSKECNTSHVAEKVQLIDRAIKSTSSATDTKQPDIGTSQADVPAGVPFLQENTVPDDKTTHAQESYTCDRCNKTFLRRTSFRQHWHTHEKHMYSCPTCNRTFYDKSNFKKHNRIHSGDRPFSCVLCNKSFSDPTGLKYHKLRNH